MPQPRIVRSYFICTASCDYAFNTDWIVHDVHFLGRRHLSVDLCGWEDLLGTATQPRAKLGIGLDTDSSSPSSSLAAMIERCCLKMSEIQNCAASVHPCSGESPVNRSSGGEDAGSSLVYTDGSQIVSIDSGFWKLWGSWFELAM